MRKVIILFAIAVAFSCQRKDDAKPAADVAPDSSAVVKPMVGADEDLHGCKTSAGYTWSELKGECVRVFEIATPLKSYDSSAVQMPAFVIFEGDRVELFVQTEKPMILKRQSEGEPFVNGQWQLIPWKGYVLKKDGKIVYTGK